MWLASVQTQSISGTVSEITSISVWGLVGMSELGYGMLFGSDVKKQFFQKRIKGRGYCDVGTSVISEFYTPLVPKGYDFLGTIGELAHIRQDGQVACEAKATGTD